MQALIVNTLLAVVILTAAYLWLVVGRREGSMTQKQKSMLRRIFVSATILLVLQLLPARVFAGLTVFCSPAQGGWCALCCTWPITISSAMTF